MALQLIPAVDVLGIEAVRLEQGDFRRIAVRAEATPEELVGRFAAAGASLVHVVDLDGARGGTLRPKLIRRLVASAAPAAVQASGGIRSLDDARALLDAGANRVVVGTAAFADDEALERYADALGERLVVALDVRDGQLQVAGWERAAGMTVAHAATRCAEAGVARILCTAIDRDGTLGGPDISLLAGVVEVSGLPVLAAGGIAAERDLDAVAGAGCEGAVVGRAFLDGRLPLERLG
jgi:phosphoribosylformimino-5-aminoimidazole carboxamide ribotide isomerase